MTVEILQIIGFDAAIGIVDIPFPPSGNVDKALASTCPITSSAMMALTGDPMAQPNVW